MSYILFLISFDVLGPRISLITILYLLLSFASFLWPLRFFLYKWGKNQSSNCVSKMNFLRWCNDLLVLFLHGELLLFHLFQLITEIEFGGLLLQFGEFVLIFGYFAEGRLDTNFQFNQNLMTCEYSKRKQIVTLVLNRKLTICLGDRWQGCWSRWSVEENIFL